VGRVTCAGEAVRNHDAVHRYMIVRTAGASTGVRVPRGAVGGRSGTGFRHGGTAGARIPRTDQGRRCWQLAKKDVPTAARSADDVAEKEVEGEIYGAKEQAKGRGRQADDKFRQRGRRSEAGFDAAKTRLERRVRRTAPDSASGRGSGRQHEYLRTVQDGPGAGPLYGPWPACMEVGGWIDEGFTAKTGSHSWCVRRSDGYSRC